jgi:hypothetical protein
MKSDDILNLDISYIKAFVEAERIVYECPKLVQPDLNSVNLARAYLSLNDKINKIQTYINSIGLE